MEQQKLPNATMIIVLGILGYLCCCFAGLGIIPSAIAFFMARKSESIYKENPEAYDNMSQIKTGKIVALIALVINTLYLARVAYVLMTGDWDELQEEFTRAYEEAMEGQ